MNNINVSVVRGNNDEKGFNPTPSTVLLNTEGKLLVINSIIRVRMATMIQEIILNTPMELYSICANIIENININEIIDLYNKEKNTNKWKLIKYLIKNELIIIANSASVFTNKDYGKYLLSIEPKIDSLIEEIKSIY